MSNEKKLQDSERGTYSDSDIGCRNKTNQSSQKENMKRYIDNRRCQINEKVGQRWSYPQKQHVIQQLISTFSYLIPSNFNSKIQEIN